MCPDGSGVGTRKPLKDSVRIVAAELAQNNEILLKATVEGRTSFTIGFDKTALIQDIAPLLNGLTKSVIATRV